VTESPSQTSSVVVETLRAWNPKAVAEVIEFHGETTIVVPHDLLRAAAAQCKEHTSLQFDLLTDATCIDRYPLEPRFDLNYQLVSILRKDRVRLRTRIDGQNARVDSLITVWLGANWLEREIFDLFGIQFAGHPDLRRILMPDNWEGHPLRKDFPVEGHRDTPVSKEIFKKSAPL
jgi:NADH-quinone oxidoreductase subunit C